MDNLSAAPLWDLSLPPSLPALADEEFITLLQKQFGANNGAFSTRLDDDKEEQPPATNINPQNLTRIPIPRPADSPPSDDSSPSPQEPSSSMSRRQSGAFDLGNSIQQIDDLGDDDLTLKRKADEENLDNEPSLKTQHTSATKKGSSSSRRKSTGNPSADESRLLKRKEQNRAAQRAFRERKEKHVKDLEDKVAALEEKNAAALQENESLREVVGRLQSENMRLRQSSFTFAVPSSASAASTSQAKEAGPSRVGSSDLQRDTPMNLFNSPPSTTTSSTASTHDSPESIFANENSDGQLSFLGQNLFSFNSGQQQQQQTATSDAMNLDLGFAPVTHTPYTTIASNPLFMSFREPEMFDTLAQPGQSQNSNQGPNHGDMSQNHNNQSYDFAQSLFPGWPDNGSGPNAMQAFDLTNSLDELFGAYSNGTGLDYTLNPPKGSPADSLSPIAHQVTSQSSPGASSSSASASGSSPSVGGSPDVSSGCGSGKKCTKEALAQVIAQDSGSVFAPRQTPSTPSSEDSSPGKTGIEGAGAGDADACDEFPPCKGLQLPKTQKSDKNVEVMSAWRTIRQDPKFQDVDINQLCSEFASKARCDGCHVVIEPNGMQEILESVQSHKRAKQQSRLFSASDAFTAGGSIHPLNNPLNNPLNK